MLCQILNFYEPFKILDNIRCWKKTEKTDLSNMPTIKKKSEKYDCLLITVRKQTTTTTTTSNLPVSCLSGNGGTEIHGNFIVNLSNNQSKCLNR